MNEDTIAAVATPSGRGGIGIVRVSGSLAKNIAQTITGITPKPRTAEYVKFHDAAGNIIDFGLVLLFIAPHSFTGEDVVEFHGHGSPVSLDGLLASVLAAGARMAKPGEFSERAFLNDKIDLIQAEAIADLIDASSTQAAKAAIRSLQGEFSACIQQLLNTLIELRLYVEAAIDFPEEEIDFISEGNIAERLADLIAIVQQIYAKARQGVMLREGGTVVIAGLPNAGKSSLLNRLCGQESAIVTDIPGTTRDVLREWIQLDGLPIQIIDTAGLRESGDVIEQEGIRRAWQEIEKAERILLVIESKEKLNESLHLIAKLPQQIKVTVIHNKIDLQNETARVEQEGKDTNIYLSAKTGEGIDLLRSHLKKCFGYTPSEGNFSARRRHLDALARAEQALLQGQKQLMDLKAGELLAQDLLEAQQALSEITGEFTADDLLGEIFSQFCIGK